MSVIITADSTCDLPKDIIESRNIKITPLSILLGSESYLDGEEITLDDIYAHVSKTGEMPKTAAVSPASYYEVFSAASQQGDSVVHISLSSAISSSYQNAVTAAGDFSNVHVVDSKNLCGGMGLLVLKACDLRDKGFDAKKIANRIRSLVPKVHATFVLDNLVYLYKGGRCSAVARFGANVLGIKPVIVDTNEYGLLDPETVSEALKDGVKAILYFEPVCQIPSSFADIENIKAVGLPIIEDITESIGSQVESDRGDDEDEGKEAQFVKAGMVGDVVIAALEEDGIISTGGGAVAVSSGQEHIERLKKYADLGTPYIDLPDMNAALGIVQLSKIDTLLERRRSIYQMYLQAQRKSDTKLFGSASPLFSSNGYGFSVIVKARPDEAIAFATKYSVSCRRTFTGSVGQRYQDKYDRFPNAIAFITRAISFPLYPFLSKQDLETIQRVISHVG